MTKGLDRLIGLRHLKEMARRDISASRTLNEQFAHTLLAGPGGLGKTAFAEAMAEELDYYFFHIEGSTVNSKNDLTQLLVRADLESRQAVRRLLFFVDECHRLGRLQEVLYYPLTKWYIITKNGRQRLSPFTMFAATTHPNMLLPSFVTRLSNTWYLHPYTTLEVQRMVDMKFREWNVGIPPHVSQLIAERSLGIPRLANNLSLKVRNEVIYRGSHTATIKNCQKTFEIEGIDSIGLRRDHRSYLQQLYNAGGIPKGLGSISGKIGLDSDVVEGTIEPVLLALDFVDLTSRGRILTTKGREHIENCG